MFAHQVIEDVNKWKVVLRNEIDVDAIKKSIELSQKFHFGEMENVLNIFKNNDGWKKRKIFQHEYFKTPFNYCCFDATHLNGSFKRFYLLVNEENIYYLYIFIKDKSMSHWAINPYAFSIQGEDNNVQFMNIYKEEYRQKFNHESVFTSAALSCLDMFILLLNCKNIETVNNYPPKKLNNARRRKGKQELFTYKTLRLKLPSAKQERSESQPTGEHNRIHFCRGHFKEYTEEHPLFGKVTGLYWWQPHVRGQNKDGIVMKDYEVKAQ